MGHVARQLIGALRHPGVITPTATDKEKLSKSVKSVEDCISKLSSKPIRKQPYIISENLHRYNLHHSACLFQTWLVSLLLKKYGPESRPVGRPENNL